MAAKNSSKNTEKMNEFRMANEIIASVRQIHSDQTDETLKRYYVGNAGGFGMGNPGQYLMDYRPSKSESMWLGYPYLCDQLYYDSVDEIERMDLTISGTLNLIVGNLQSRPHQFVIDDPDNALQTEAMEFIKNTVEPLLYDLVRVIVGYAMGPGFSVGELMWNPKGKDGKWTIDGIEHKHPGLFCFDAKHRMCWYSGYFNGEHSSKSLVPPGRFTISRISAKYSNPYGDGLILRLAPYFWMKKQMILQGMDFIQRFAMPIPVAKISMLGGMDSSATANADFESMKARLASALGSLRRGDALILPENIDVDIKDASNSGKGFQPHLDWIAWINTAILTYMMGSTLGVEAAERGTRALGEVHERTSDLRVRPLAVHCANVINKYVINPLLVVNYGEKALDSVKIEIDMENSEELTDTISSLDALLNKAGLPAKVEEAYERLGWQKPDEDDETTTGAIAVGANLFGPGGPGGSPGAAPEPPPTEFPETIDDGGGTTEAPQVLVDESQMASNPLPDDEGVAGNVENPDSDSKKKDEINIEPPSEPPPLQSEAAEIMAPVALNFVRIHTKVGEVAASLEKGEMQRAIRDYIKSDAQGLMDFKPDNQSRLALGAGLLLSGFEAGQEIKAHDETTGNAVFASKFSEEKTDVEAAYDDYHRAVNMTASELESWAESEASKKASLDRSPITRNLRLLRKPKAEWTARDAAAARKTTAFIARMRKVKAGDDVGDTGMSKRTISLKNWAFDPNKSSMSADESGDILKFNQSTALIFPADFPEAFQESAQWMIDRGILTRAQVLAWALESADVWSALAETYGGNEGLRRLFENSIRERTLALKDAVDTTLTRKIQEELSANIAAGQTRTAFLEALDKRVEAGEVPGGDAYLNTVYRTEVANAYERQSVEIETIPEVDEYLWGWLIMTAEDNQVRPGHAALQGLYFKKGGQAADLLGRPPWSYNCRCIIVRQIQSVPGAAGENEYQESEGALAAAAGVERF